MPASMASRSLSNPVFSPVARAAQLVLLGWALAATAVQAAEPPAAGQAQAYRIEAGPLGRVLSEVAATAGMALSFDPALTQGRQSPVLSGSFTPREALQRLLAGSGLELVSRPGGSYTLQRQAVAPVSSEEGSTLSEVRVTAQAERSGTTEGTGSYTQTGPSRTATGLGLTLRETPQSVSVMTRQRMDDFKLETLADVLEQTPGIGVYRQNNATDFQARGSEVNLQVDGMSQLSNGWYFVTSTMYALDDMAEMDRVEVLKGSSGLVVGKGGYGATVNLIRKRPTREFQASVRANAGSWDTYRAQADISGSLNEAGTLRGRVVASMTDAGSFRDNEKSNSKMLFGTLEADLTPDTLLNLGITLRQREARGFGTTRPIQRYTAAGAEVGLMPRSFNNGAPWSGYEQESTELFGSVEQRLAHDWTATLKFFHQSVKMDDMTLGYLWNSTTAAYLPWQDVENRNWSVNLDVKGPFTLLGRTHELLAGVGVSRYHSGLLYGSSKNVPLANLGLSYAQGGGALAQPDFRNWNYDRHVFNQRQQYAYTAGRFRLADPLQLIAGMRVTQYRQHDVTPTWWNYDMRETVTTPYAGLVYEVHPQVSLYGSYATIFKPQSAQDEQGRTLDPEQGKTYEVGAKGEFFDKRLNASIAHFWMKTDNSAEETGSFTPGGDMAYRAVSGATRRGWELELSGELARGWQVQGSLVQQNSSLTSSSQYPKYQLKLGSTYRFEGGALRGLTLGAATRWQSKTSTSDSHNTLAQQSYAVLDLMARYQVDKHLSLSLNVNNLLDKKYFAGVSSLGGLYYTWGAPRSVNVGMRYDF